MIERLFSDPAMRVLGKALDASSQTQETIAHNLANVDTPGFKRSEVLFQDQLTAALKATAESASDLKGLRTDSRHIPIGEPPTLEDVKPRVVVRAETSLRPDGNNVDLDSEMTRLAQNTLLYQSLAQLVRTKLAWLRSAINEGRK